MSYFLAALKKYAVFRGRAHRAEYWWFVLFYAIFLVGVIVVDTCVTRSEYLTNLYKLAMLIPTIAVGVRRMHDINHSGWWILCPIVNLVFSLSAGDKGENRFGPDPKEPATLEAQISSPAN